MWLSKFFLVLNLEVFAGLPGSQRFKNLRFFMFTKLNYHQKLVLRDVRI